MDGLKVLTLKRISMTEESTLGVLLEDKKPFCLTMELPWRNNAINESCIPYGEYLCHKQVRIRHGTCFEVMQVPNRCDILIHKGNYPGDSRGCIIVGEQFEDELLPDGTKVVTAVLASGQAYSELMRKMLSQDSFKLIIEEKC